MTEVPQRPSVSGTVSAPVLRPDFDDLIANQKEIIEKFQVSIINEDDSDSNLIKLGSQIELLERLQDVKISSVSPPVPNKFPGLTGVVGTIRRQPLD